MKLIFWRDRYEWFPKCRTGVKFFPQRYSSSGQCFSICFEIYGPVVVEKAPGTDIRFSISKDESMHKVAKELYDDGLIVNRYSFYIRTMLMDRDEMKLKPGDYILNTSMDYEEILDMLTKSD